MSLARSQPPPLVLSSPGVFSSCIQEALSLSIHCPLSVNLSLSLSLSLPVAHSLTHIFNHPPIHHEIWMDEKGGWEQGMHIQ